MLRRQALDLLKAELTALDKLLSSGQTQNRAAVVQAVQHGKKDSEVSGIRDAEALAKLPEPEITEWRAFWEEVKTLLKAGAMTAPLNV